MKPLLFFCLILIGPLVNSQNLSLEITLSNQPHNYIEIGMVKGDRFIYLDSISGSETAQGKFFKYQFTKDAQVGMYRVILGQTRYAELMNEAPQQLDIIFNHENIKIKTDFEKPDEKIEVLESDENKAWFAFKIEEKMYRQYLNQLRSYINNSNQEAAKTKEKKDEYNLIMMQRENLIRQSVEKNEGLFAARIINMYHEPLVDAYLSADDGRKAYIDEYFNNIDFSDEELINSTIYTDKIIHYIQSYGQYGLSPEEQEMEFIKAVDIALEKVKGNQAVFEFILDYIVRGFEKLHLNHALTHIADKFELTTCQTDEKTTLERRLGFQKMKLGSQVPDFTLNDLNGDPVILSDIVKEKTLILFWASWCPHCVSMIPELKTYLETHPNENIEVVAISIDSSLTDWQKKVFELNIESWYNLSDLKSWDGKVSEMYNVYATPTMFLIDSEMKILSKPYDLIEVKAALK